LSTLIFSEEEIDLQDLLSLPNDELERIVGDRQDYDALLLAKGNKKKLANGSVGDGEDLDEAIAWFPDSIDTLLTKNGLEEYIPAFKGNQTRIHNLLTVVLSFEVRPAHSRADQ
jgi:hypothetical protein